MVCEWGMSDELGPLTYGEKEEQIFLGREIAQHRDYSEETARRIDTAVTGIVTACTEKTLHLIEANRDLLERMAQELLDKETIMEGDIKRIFAELRQETTVGEASAQPKTGHTPEVKASETPSTNEDGNG